MLVRDLLKNISDDFVTVSPDVDIQRAAAMMIEQTVSALVVQMKNGQLAGILTERDVARHFATANGETTTPVSAAMTGDVITCSTERPVSEIAAIMSDSNIRHLPVLRDGKVIEIISIRDIVRYHLSALESENRALRELVAALD
jgi:CBS domain-containing protein